MKPQKQSVADRQTALLRYAKNEIPKHFEHDDPFGDQELFETETARFFAAEGTQVEIDPEARGNFRLIVRTSLFGGNAKHIHGVKYKEATNFVAKKGKVH